MHFDSCKISCVSLVSRVSSSAIIRKGFLVGCSISLVRRRIGYIEDNPAGRGGQRVFCLLFFISINVGSAQMQPRLKNGNS